MNSEKNNIVYFSGGNQETRYNNITKHKTKQKIKTYRYVLNNDSNKTLATQRRHHR